MPLPSPRFLLFFALSVLILFATPSGVSANDRDDRHVVISFVQGDVRLSRGGAKHPDLNKAWVALPGTLAAGLLALAVLPGTLVVEAPARAVPRPAPLTTKRVSSLQLLSLDP